MKMHIRDGNKKSVTNSKGAPKKAGKHTETQSTGIFTFIENAHSLQ